MHNNNYKKDLPNRQMNQQFHGIRSYLPHLEQWEKISFYAGLACYQFHTAHGRHCRRGKGKEENKNLGLTSLHP